METPKQKVSLPKPQKSLKSYKKQGTHKFLQDSTTDLATSTSETPSAQSSPLSTRVLFNSPKPSNVLPLDFTSESFSKNPSSTPKLLSHKNLAKNNIKTQARTIDDYELCTDPDLPSLTWCAYCAGERTFRLEYRPSGKTFLASSTICFFGGVFGCFLIPYFVSECQTAHKRCMKCDRLVE